MLCFRVPRANLGSFAGFHIPVLDGLGDLVERWKSSFGSEVARVEARSRRLLSVGDGRVDVLALLMTRLLFSVGLSL